MIDKAMETIKNELNAYYKQRFSLDENKAIIANLISQEGNVAAGDINKIVLTLINIEEETSLKNQRNIKQVGDSYHKTNKPLQINFYIVCAAYFSDNNYSEALKFISSVILFFQNKQVFSHNNTPDLDEDIDKLVLELINLDLQTLSGFWSFIGAKYLPSLIFKVKMLTFEDSMVTEVRKAAHEPAQESENR